MDLKILFCEGITIKPPSLLFQGESAFEKLVEYSASPKPVPEWGYLIPAKGIEMHGFHWNYGLNVRKGQPTLVRSVPKDYYELLVMSRDSVPVAR